MTKPKITIKQQKFIDVYTGNATEAATKAGFAHPMQQGQSFLKGIQAELSEIDK